MYKAEIAADFDWDAARDDAENVPSMLLYTHYVIQDSLQKMRHFKTKDKRKYIEKEKKFLELDSCVEFLKEEKVIYS